jgi:hypothetical protein
MDCMDISTNPYFISKSPLESHRQALQDSHHLSSHRLHRLRIIKQLRRIVNRLDILQPRQACSVVVLARSRPVQPRIGVVDVHSPVVFGQRRRDVGDPVVEEPETVGWVGTEEAGVVELD